MQIVEVDMNKTEEDVKFKKRRHIARLRQFIATVCLGPISLGASISWTSPVLPQLLLKNSTNYTGFNSTEELPQLLENNATESPKFYLTVEEGSWVGSMLAIGVLIAAIPSGYLAGRFGLKTSTLALVVPVLLFTIIICFANDVYSVCIARLLLGIATGGISVVGPMYISEIADVSLRGTLGSFFEFLVYLGVVFVAICGAYLHYVTLTIILGVLGLVLGSVFLYLPESPSYLMKLNNRAKAEKALKFYRSETYNVATALDEMHERIHHKQEVKKINVWVALRSKAVRRGLVATTGLTVFQQLSGIDGVTFYTVQIFQAAGTDVDEYTSAIIVSSVQLISAIVIVFVIEKAGRKIFLYISAVGTCVCLALLALYFHLKENDINFYGMGAIPLISLVVYACAFSTGLGPIPWMVNGELFVEDVKGIANGITITSNWIFLFIITKTLPIMMKDIGAHYTFYFYSICMFICIIFTKFCVPETRGKSLEQIQTELNS